MQPKKATRLPNKKNASPPREPRRLPKKPNERLQIVSVFHAVVVVVVNVVVVNVAAVVAVVVAVVVVGRSVVVAVVAGALAPSSHHGLHSKRKLFRPAYVNF